MAEEIKKEVTEPKPKAKSTKSKSKSKPKEKVEEQPKTRRGVVVSCKRLNVRSLGIMTSGVVAILNQGDSVLIDPEKSTEGWYAVKTKNGKNGFCMKKYIKIP